MFLIITLTELGRTKKQRLVIRLYDKVAFVPATSSLLPTVVCKIRNIRNQMEGRL